MAPFVLKLTYSQLAKTVATPGILADKDGDLPSHLNTLPRVVCWKRAPQLGALLKNRGPTNNKMRSQLPAPWLGDGELAPGDFTWSNHGAFFSLSAADQQPRAEDGCGATGMGSTLVFLSSAIN